MTRAILEHWQRMRPSSLEDVVNTGEKIEFKVTGKPSGMEFMTPEDDIVFVLDNQIKCTYIPGEWIGQYSKEGAMDAIIAASKRERARVTVGGTFDAGTSTMDCGYLKYTEGKNEYEWYVVPED